MAVRRSAWGLARDASAEQMLDEKGSWPQMASLTAQADVVIVACSQDATTRGFLNQAFLSACKPGVIIVNVARGKEGLRAWMASLTPQADIVIVTRFQDAPTCCSVSQAFLSVCKHGVITMNVARGERHPT